MSTKATARPFVKWAGGKTQLLPALSQILPKKIRTYYEPFVGGGAVYFTLAARERFERAVLNDRNRELMNSYTTIKEDLESLVQALKERADAYADAPVATFDYWKARELEELSPLLRATRMLFLNKTCFNGLYRVNRKGEFNVPFGRYANPRICDETNLRACSELLNNIPTTLLSVDFVEAVADAQEGDVVYLDPPYLPLSSTSNFASYTSGGFGIDDHHRLAALFKVLINKGVTVVVSNSDTETTRALYEGYEIHSVQAKRHINSKGDGRGAIGELIIVGRLASATPVQVEEEIPVSDLARCIDCGELFDAELTACPACSSLNMTIAEIEDGDQNDEGISASP